MKASARIRLRPSRSFAIGSCRTTIRTVLTRKIRPIPFSLTLASFFANTGRSSKTAYPAETKTTLSATTPTKTLRKRTVKLPGLDVVAMKPPVTPPRPMPSPRDALEGVRGVAAGRRGQTGQERGLAGQKPAFPAPATAMAAKAYQGSRTSGKIP